MGTPNEDEWPGVTSLPDYKTSFPQWSATSLKKHVPGLNEDGLELLAELLVYDPSARMSGGSSSIRTPGHDRSAGGQC